MRSVGVRRWVPVLLVGLAMLATAGCFGGNRNFTASAEASAADVSGDPSKREVGARPGNVAPDFVLKDLEGQQVRLSELRGKPVMVNFWATWCPPCREEMPVFEKVYRKYQSQGIVFLGVNMKESADTVREFVQANRYSWTFLLDSTGQVATSFRASAIPTTFFVDGEGVIRDVHIGALSEGLLEARLSKIR